jgi:hypothetical protein
MKNKSKYASGGAPKPMTMAERVADRNRRMAEAMGDAPKPKPKPAPKPAKPKPYAEGGMVATGMPTPQPRPSNFTVGPLQFGGPGGFGGGNMGGAGSGSSALDMYKSMGVGPRNPAGPTGMPPGGPMGGGRPMRDQRGISGGNDMNFAQNMKQDIMQKMKDRLGDRMGGIGDRMEGIRNRVRPNAPAPVGPGGGYKKGGKIDGCATRGMTKGRNK